MIARWLHPSIPPRIGDPYTCMFKRHVGMGPKDPYILVTGGLTEGHSGQPMEESREASVVWVENGRSWQGCIFDCVEDQGR